jgi:hypothetical protein
LLLLTYPFNRKDEEMMWMALCGITYVQVHAGSLDAARGCVLGQFSLLLLHQTQQIPQILDRKNSFLTRHSLVAVFQLIVERMSLSNSIGVTFLLLYMGP